LKKLLENVVKSHQLEQWLAIGLIIFATTVVYYKSLKTPFIFDDIFKIVENSDIKDLSNLKTKLVYPYSKEHYNFSRNDPSRPLTYLTYALNYHFGKLNTYGYHLVNLAIHILTAILLFILTKKIILYAYEKETTLFPLFTALFFAVHPVNMSTVTYIFSRSVLLSTFFYLSSLVLFVRAFEKKNTIVYVFSLLSFVLALFSRQDVVTLPAIILLFDYVFLSDFKTMKVKEKRYYHLPFWIILFIYLLFRYFYFGGLGDVEAKAGSVWNRYSYLIIQPYMILRYFKLLFVPIGLCIDHVISPVKTLEPKIIISFISLAVIFWLTYRIYRKKTDSSKIVIFSVLWFFIILLPTSSFFPTTRVLAENRLYLSGIGFYVVIVFLYFSVFQYLLPKAATSPAGKLSFFLILVMCSYVFLLGYVTVERNHLYRNPMLIWQDVISKYPDNSGAHNNLGLSLINLNRFEEAEKAFREAIKKNPSNPEAHSNLGNVLGNTNRFEEAEKEFREAIKISPDFISARTNLGVLLDNTNRFEEAEKEYRKAIKINPNFANAHYNLGFLLVRLNRYEEAEKEYGETIRINPDDEAAHVNLGILLYDLRRYKEAEKEYRQAIKINLGGANAHYNLGLLLYKLKRYGEAEREFLEAVKITPYDSDAHYNLGNLYYELKKYDDALREYETALGLSLGNRFIRNKIKSLRQLTFGKK